MRLIFISLFCVCMYECLCVNNFFSYVIDNDRSLGKVDPPPSAHFIFTFFLFFYRHFFLILVSLFAPISDPPVVKRNEDNCIQRKKYDTKICVHEREKERVDCGACEPLQLAHLEILPPPRNLRENSLGR